MSGLKPAPPLKKTQHIDDSHPYGLFWLDSYFQEVFLPNGEWQKVARKVSPQLASRIRKQFDHEKRKQMIFELVGPDFVGKFFPNEEYKPTLVQEPDISHEERKKLLVDAQNWLQKELSKAASEAGCERPLPGIGPQNEQSREMVGFLAQARFLALKDLDIHLYLQEREVKRAWENYQWEQNQAKDKEAEQLERLELRREYERLTGTATGPRSILRDSSTPHANQPPSTACSIFTTASEADRKPTANIKGAMYGAVEDPPTFWGMQSNSIGRSVAALLRRDPRRYGEVAARLHGRQLPGTLRTYLWLDMLFRAERERMNDVNAEKFVRERFGKAISRGISDLKVKRASHSPISGLIDNAVIEIYDRSPGMKMYLNQNQHMKEAAKALNILYVYDRTYEPYLIYWLFPLQLTFSDFSDQSEHVYDLAMYMDLLNKSCYPTWPQIFAVAERTMARLSEVDRELHDHLETISRINVSINPKEFLVQMIHEEKTKAQTLLSSSPGLTQSATRSRELLANPRIFLRKWIGEGFASVLDTQAVIYVWDQCFLQRWRLQVLEDFCLAIVLLLRHEFLDASNYKQMRRVFLREPCKLYTKDIQHAWVHVQKGGACSRVPGINRRNQNSRPTTVEPIAPRPLTPPSYVSPAPSTASYRPLPPVGIKHLRLKLELTSQNSTPNPASIRLRCTVYFGMIELTTLTTDVTGQSPGIQTSKYGARTMLVTFPKQRLVFSSLDTSQFDLEQEMGGYPYAVLQAKLDTAEGAVPLGWARIRLFQAAGEAPHRANMPSSAWVLMEGTEWHPMYGGVAQEQGPRSVSRNQDQQQQALIGNNSQLCAMVFDPDHEPGTPEPTPQATPTPAPKTATPRKTPVPTPAALTPEKPKSPEFPGISDTFVLHIDGVDNIPDNATITKVTGRLLKTGSLSGMEDLLAVPELSSRARCPRYQYRLIVNETEAQTDMDMLALLRVYTVNRITGNLSVIGSSLIRIFDQKTGKVRVGGHQRVLHYGMPDINLGMAALSHTSLDSGSRIPGCTVYYRLLPFTEETAAKPTLDEDNYPMDDSRFNESEKRVIQSYKTDKKHPKTTEDMAKKLKAVESNDETDTPIDTWLTERLDQRRHLAPSQTADFLPLRHMVHYRQGPGLSVLVSRAAGLPDGLYPVCLARVLPGDGAKDLPVTDAGHGHEDEKLVAVQVDIDSRHTTPKWLDDVKTLHPHWDLHTVLLVQVFGISVQYTSSTDHKDPGKLTNPAGAELELREEHIIGWTVLPLFEELYANSGEHHLPLFKGQPDQGILKALASNPVQLALNNPEWLQANTLGNASLVVDMWDGHFSESELLEPLQRNNSLLDIVGSKDAYTKAQQDPQGKRFQQLVLNGLATPDQSQGTSGSVYTTEKEHFKQLIQKQSTDLLETYVLEAGYGPL